LTSQETSIRRGWAAVLALAALLCLAAFSPAVATAGSISGIVTDGPPLEAHLDCLGEEGPECGETFIANGIEGMEVCAYPFESEEEGWCELTESEGRYSIDELPADEYLVEFWGKPLGYVAQYYDGRQSWWEADPVSVGTEAVTGIDAEMLPGGTIEGTVTRAPGGEPVEEVEICAFGAESELWGGCTFPDSEGNYALRGLLAGEYIVEFWPYEPDLLGQFYDGKSKPSEADPVSVAVGETQSGIDAELQLGSTIEGTVRAASNGAPVEWVEVCAWGVLIESAGCAFSGADGNYAIRGLRAGNYKVEFWTGESETNLLDQYWDHKANWSEANPLAITAGETRTGINADLLAPPPLPLPSSAASLPPAATPPPAANPLPRKKKCRKGFKRKKVKGKVRCVKVRKHRRHRQQNRVMLRERAAYDLTRGTYRFGR
jgi:hypothetical protein